MVSGWVAILPVPIVTGERASCTQGQKEKGTLRDQVKAHPKCRQDRQKHQPGDRQTGMHTH